MQSTCWYRDLEPLDFYPLKKPKILYDKVFKIIQLKLMLHLKQDEYSYQL